MINLQKITFVRPLQFYNSTRKTRNKKDMRYLTVWSDEFEKSRRENSSFFRKFYEGKWNWWSDFEEAGDIFEKEDVPIILDRISVIWSDYYREKMHRKSSPILIFGWGQQKWKKTKVEKKVEEKWCGIVCDGFSGIPDRKTVPGSFGTELLSFLSKIVFPTMEKTVGFLFSNSSLTIHTGYRYLLYSKKSETHYIFLEIKIY